MTGIPTDLPVPSRKSGRLPAWVFAVAFVILLGFLTLIGIGLSRSQQGPIKTGSKVPSIALTTFDGTQVNTQDLAGKVIVINFWASWCVPCADEAPILEQAWQYYQPEGQVVFLGVDWVDSEKDAKAFLAKYQISYINGPDLRTTISQMFRIRGVPETYIIDKQGRLANTKIGPFSTVDEVKSTIDPLIK